VGLEFVMLTRSFLPTFLAHLFLQLSAKLTEKELEINQLSAKQQSEEDGEKLKSLGSTRLRLQSKEREVVELEAKLSETKKEWSQALGNEEKMKSALEEQLSKFQKRWSEFTSALDGDVIVSSENETTDVPSLAEQVSQAKRIVELQHKLCQALENVRQAESARLSLGEALDMNLQLQSELEEIKSKYAALQASRTVSVPRPTDVSPNPESGVTGAVVPMSSTPTEKPSTESSSKFEKMHRDYRRARKELAAMTQSKEAAKAKLERSEKERESLIDTNSRLLRQSTEKDEMNAKSLATILHLKSLTEQQALERENLEQQVNSASQLALSARLATNAKERLSEEVVKERQDLEGRFEILEKEHAQTKAELAKIALDFSEGSGTMTSLSTQLSNALKRSEDLVAENTAKADEMRKLVESAEAAERVAREANDKLNMVLKSPTSGGDVASVVSAFTVGQLTTQISVLKGRLACPVCHYRDKECIIMRCRHMHCKQCVDERISNRSRKCPTCNNKFSEKDVEDVWLS
jgi:E3 ubiquitin-protein ligase BRE1